MSDEPDTMGQGDPVLLALEEYLAVLRSLKADMAALDARLARIEAILTPPEPEPERPPLSDFHEYLAQVVDSLYRDQGRKPVATRAVSMRIGYTPGYTLQVLKDAVGAGAICVQPGRGKRCSGLFIPVQKNS